MTSMIRLGFIFLALTGASATLPAVEGVTIFESCTDRRGNGVPVLPDTAQVALVRSAVEAGRTVIRYNAEALTRLSTSGRVFFYAHQCARLGLDDAGKDMTSARTADCLGLNALLDGGMLKYGDMPDLQAELSFSDAEWELLPGPPRNIDLSTCRPTGLGVLRLPLATPPSARQTTWNNCLRGPPLELPEDVWQQRMRQLPGDLRALQGGVRGSAGGDPGPLASLVLRLQYRPTSALFFRIKPIRVEI